MEAGHQDLVRIGEAWLKQGGENQDLVDKASDVDLKDPDNPKMHHLGRIQTFPTLRNRRCINSIPKFYQIILILGTFLVK